MLLSDKTWQKSVKRFKSCCGSSEEDTQAEGPWLSEHSSPGLKPMHLLPAGFRSHSHSKENKSHHVLFTAQELVLLLSAANSLGELVTGEAVPNSCVYHFACHGRRTAGSSADRLRRCLFHPRTRHLPWMLFWNMWQEAPTHSSEDANRSVSPCSKAGVVYLTLFPSDGTYVHLYVLSGGSTLINSALKRCTAVWLQSPLHGTSKSCTYNSFTLIRWLFFTEKCTFLFHIYHSSPNPFQHRYQEHKVMFVQDTVRARPPEAENGTEELYISICNNDYRMSTNKGVRKQHKAVTGSSQIIGSFSSPEVSDLHSHFSTSGKNPIHPTGGEVFNFTSLITKILDLHYWVQLLFQFWQF